MTEIYFPEEYNPSTALQKNTILYSITQIFELNDSVQDFFSPFPQYCMSAFGCPHSRWLATPSIPLDSKSHRQELIMVDPHIDDMCTSKIILSILCLLTA